MILHTDTSSAELYDHGGVKIHVVRNSDLETLLFNRNLIGTPFRTACLAASRHFVAHIADEYRPDDSAELLILSKGILYQLAQAFADVTGKNLATNLIATSRVAVAGDDVKISVMYSQLEAPARTVIIGDTVASGATIVRALTAYTEFYDLERVYVFSYAGTGLGAQRVADFCRANNVSCTFLFGLAVFGLGNNGFDLSFLHPETVSTEEYRERARRQFNGRPVSAVGWDFGSQATAPAKYRHLCWVEAEVWGLLGADCFRVAERPDDTNELAHERTAFEGRWPPDP